MLGIGENTAGVIDLHQIAEVEIGRSLGDAGGLLGGVGPVVGFAAEAAEEPEVTFGGKLEGLLEGAPFFLKNKTESSLIT